MGRMFKFIHRRFSLQVSAIKCFENLRQASTLQTKFLESEQNLH